MIRYLRRNAQLTLLKPQKAGAFCAVLALAWLPPVPSHGQALDAAQFVLAFNHDLSAQMAPPSLSLAERRDRFSALIDRGLDLAAIGDLVLGWRWARAAPTDQAAFQREFRHYLVQTFAARMTGVPDNRLVVLGTRPEGPASIVLTEIAGGEGAPRPIEWRVVRSSAGWRLCDVSVNHVSMAAIMRSQVDAVLTDGRPEFGAVLQLLHDKAPE